MPSRRLLYVLQAPETIQVYYRSAADGSLALQHETTLPGAGALAAWALDARQRVLTVATRHELVSLAIDPTTGDLRRISVSARTWCFVSFHSSCWSDHLCICEP